MDRRERGDSPIDNMLAFQQGVQSVIWTAMPGIIQSFDAEKMTAVVQPALQGQVQASDGSYSWQTMPLCVDCPVQFPGGGGVSLTFPVAEGDECLLVFASRCIDAWWQSGGVQRQAELRMHDLSDGMALLGFRSVPRVIPNISTTVAQLRSDDGSTAISLDPVGSVVSIDAATIDLNGELFINGSPYLEHKHDETAAGLPGDLSGEVVP